MENIVADRHKSNWGDTKVIAQKYVRRFLASKSRLVFGEVC